MAKLSKRYTTDGHEPSTPDYAPLPVGWYRVRITDATLKESRSGGEYMNVRYDVSGGDHDGRVVFGMITTQHRNSKAVEIGEQQILDLAAACGIVELDDTDQLVGHEIDVRLKIERSDEYGDRNRVVAWLPAGTKTKGASAPAVSAPRFADDDVPF